RQPMRQLAVGLARYDPLQEGLGVLAEYLAGYLPGERLRVLAARVIAADMALHGSDIPAIFACLHEGHGFATEEAFDIAVRAARGGAGGLVAVFVGKCALDWLVVRDELADAGWRRPPAVLPGFARAPGFAARLRACRASVVRAFPHVHPGPLPIEDRSA